MTSNIITALVLIFLVSCSRPNKEIQQRISDADSMAINYFKGDGSMDTVVSVKIIRDKQLVNQLATLISDKTVKGDFSCGYDGSIHFFKMNAVAQDVDFRMKKNGCMLFSFVQYGKKEFTALSSTAAELISSFKK